MFRNKIGSASELLIVLLSVVVFQSCIETNYTLGDALVPTSNNLYVESASIDLKVGMKSAADMQSSSYYYDMGSVYSEQFGLMSVDLAATVTPSDTGINFGTDPRFMEAYLILLRDNVQTFTTGQDNITQNLYVYPMAHAMDSTMVTCSSLGEDDYIHTPVGQALLTSQDTVIIPLDTEWASKLMEATRAELDSMRLFIEKHFGLYFTTDSPIEGIVGGRLNNFESIDIKMIISSVNYKNLRRDTTITFNVGSVYNGLSTQIFKHSSKDLEIGPDNNEEVLYYEGLAGIKPFIDARILRSSIEAWAQESGIDLKKIMITRATFELPFEFPEDYKMVDNYYPQGLYPAVYGYEADSIKRYTLLGSVYDDTYDKGGINRSLFCYRPDVTYYIHALINKEELSEDDDIWLIAPFEYIETTSSSSGSSYYNPYYYNSYYNPYSYYGGYGGYGGYGYGGYGYGYNDYYSSLYYSSLMSSASSSSTTYYYVDYMNYAIGQINGNGAERHPKLNITYVLLDR